jgi:hypothetical protein
VALVKDRGVAAIRAMLVSVAGMMSRHCHAPFLRGVPGRCMIDFPIILPVCWLTATDPVRASDTACRTRTAQAGHLEYEPHR